MNDDLSLRVTALKVVSEFTKRAYDEARKQIAPTMDRGDRKRVRVGDTKVADVWMTDPDPVVRVSDDEALKTWASEHYPGAIESGYDVIGSDREVIDVLFEHAPHLLRQVRKLNPEWVKSIRKESLALGAVVGPGGEADVPGVQISTPAGVVTCKPTEDALPAIVALFRVNKLSLDSLTELREGAA